MCVVMLDGGIGLNIPSVVAFSGIVGALVMRDSQNIYLSAITMLFAAHAFEPLMALQWPGSRWLA